MQIVFYVPCPRACSCGRRMDSMLFSVEMGVSCALTAWLGRMAQTKPVGTGYRAPCWMCERDRPARPCPCIGNLVGRPKIKSCTVKALIKKANRNP
jgi:hypothetical protein